MEVVKIRWIDSCASNMHWSLMDEFDGDIEPIEIISFGVLIQETEECITIAQNYSINPHQCCSLMTIPKGCIKEKVLIFLPYFWAEVKKKIFVQVPNAFR